MSESLKTALEDLGTTTRIFVRLSRHEETLLDMPQGSTPLVPIGFYQD